MIWQKKQNVSSDASFTKNMKKSNSDIDMFYQSVTRFFIWMLNDNRRHHVPVKQKALKFQEFQTSSFKFGNFSKLRATINIP